MNKYLTKLFLKVEGKIINKEFVIRVINKKRIRKTIINKIEKDIFSEETLPLESMFVFNNNQIDEYVCNFMIYKWLIDHKDRRYRDFTFILKPKNILMDMRKISFNELMNFISPQTQKTCETESDIE